MGFNSGFKGLMNSVLVYRVLKADVGSKC